jgi:AcrR family transcriptional regulator
MSAAGRMTGAERREQLIGIGRQVFAERGYVAGSIEEIAHRAEVSKPLVYAHFGGKHGLYEVIVDREVDRLQAMIVAALDGADEPRDAVAEAVDAFLRYIESERDGFRILVRDAPMGLSKGSLPGVLGVVAENAESILAGEFQGRGYDPKAAPLYARALVGMVALVGQWWLETGKPRRKEVAAHLVNLAWNGLRGLERDPTGRRSSGRATRVSA